MISITDLKPGDRFLYRGFARDVSEAICLEFSTGRKMIKLKHPSGSTSWLDEHDTKSLCILDRLPNAQVDKDETGAAPADQLVEHVLRSCQGYEYAYDAYYGPDAPFADRRPPPSDVAEALQDMSRSVPKSIAQLQKSNFNLTQLAVKLEKCLAEMRNEHRCHGHITDASAHYMVVLKPLFDDIIAVCGSAGRLPKDK